MSQTPNLSLPYLAANQAMKHVTLNEALLRLDQLVQLVVRGAPLSVPPGDATEGERFLVGPSASGDWAGQDGRVAAWLDGAWTFLQSLPGWLAIEAGEGTLRVFNGVDWPVFAPQSLSVERLAINGAPDPNHPLSATASSILLTAEPVSGGGTGDLRVTLNKPAASSVLSLLFQSGWSARAEIGLVGEDALSVRVSADGTDFISALHVASTDGQVSCPAGAELARLNGGALAGMRNAVINGCFRIWARGNPVTVSDEGFGPDRFRIGGTGSVTALKVASCATVGTGGPVGPGLEISGGTQARFLETRLEGEDLLAGGTASLSVWIHAGQPFVPVARLSRVAGSVTLDIQPRLAGLERPAGWSHVHWVFDVPASVAASPDPDGYLAVRIEGLPDGVVLAQVQLEPGERATPFERRPQALEVAACARYFERFGDGQPYCSFGLASSEGTALARFVLAYAEKRTFPAISQSGVFRLRRPGGASSATITSWFMPGLRSARGEIASSSLTSGGAHEFSASNDISAHIDVDAEL